MTHVNESTPSGVFVLQPPASPSTKQLTLVNSEQIRLDDGEDTVLAMKLQLVNSAIDEIGFTTYQLKLFFLNGFGYAVDSLLILLNALTQPQIALQYQPSVSKAQSIAVGIGLLTGALFWGLGADVSKCWSCLSSCIAHVVLNHSGHWPQVRIQYYASLLRRFCHDRWCITQLLVTLCVCWADGFWRRRKSHLRYGCVFRISSRKVSVVAHIHGCLVGCGSNGF